MQPTTRLDTAPPGVRPWRERIARGEDPRPWLDACRQHSLDDDSRSTWISHPTPAQWQQQLDHLAQRLAGLVTLVLGPSGMGKSTLINLLVPQAAAQVGEISKALQTGRHTTTTSTWYWLDETRNGAHIDP